MSDYLWDKTGEPEEDVERLEKLLGQFRFQPRAFEVPAAIPVVARRAPPTISDFRRARLAVAASLVLALLAGAWLVFTKHQATTAPARIANGGGTPRNDATVQSPPEKATQPNTNQLANTQTSGDAPSVRNERRRREVVGQINAPESIRHQRHEFISAAQKRPAAPRRQSNVRDADAQREQVANNSQVDTAATTLTPQERDAMEKFLLAMRVTSEKLNYAERQVQSLRESSPQR